MRVWANLKQLFDSLHPSFLPSSRSTRATEGGRSRCEAAFSEPACLLTWLFTCLLCFACLIPVYFVCCFFDWLTDWLTDRLTDCLTDWLIDWLLDWLTDWLIDWLHGSLAYFQPLPRIRSPDSRLASFWTVLKQFFWLRFSITWDSF